MIDFATISDAQAATIPAGTLRVVTYGFYAAYDGGGASYNRVATAPAHAGKFQSADGAWWELADERPNPKQIGAYGTAVWDPVAYNWTGPDDSAKLVDWHNIGQITGKELSLGEGKYITTTGIIPTNTNQSNIVIRGIDNQKSCIVFKSTAALYNIIGTKDSAAANAIQLTSPASAGDRQVQLNNNSGITRDMVVVIADQSKNLTSNQSDGTVTAKQGETKKVKSVDASNKITFYEQLEFSYGVNADPTKTTTISRFTSPSRNFVVTDIGIEFDPSFSYTNTTPIFSFRRGVNFRSERVRFGRPRTYCYSFSDTYDFSIIDGEHEDGDGATYFIVIDAASSKGLIRGHVGTGCRHFMTTTNDVADIEPNNCVIQDCVIEGTNLAAYDQHPGARNFTWYDCTVRGAGINSTTGDVGNGWDLRGRNSQVIGFSAIGLNVGIAASYGSNNEFRQGTIKSCVNSINVLKSDHLTIDGVKIYDPIGSVILINSDNTSNDGTGTKPPPNTPIHSAYPGLKFRNIDISGNPNGVVVSTIGAAGADWLFNIKALDATVFQAGTVILTESSYYIGTIIGGILTPDPNRGIFQHYTNSGAHALGLPPAVCNVNLECNNVGAGAIDMSVFDVISGDAYSPIGSKKYVFDIKRTFSSSQINIRNIPARKLIDAISGAGLAANCMLCLDAGDLNSYASGTVWKDVSGNGCDFNFGGGTAAPVFNGIPGALTRDEFFSFSGSQYFSLAGSNPSWMNALHMDNATFSLITWLYVGGHAATGHLCGTSGSNNANVGVEINITTNPFLSIIGRGAIATATINQSLSSATVPVGAWTFGAMSLNEATGVNGIGYRVDNLAFQNKPSTYATPSSAPATYPMQIGSSGSGGAPLQAGTRLGGFAMFNTALADAAINEIRLRTLGRYA